MKKLIKLIFKSFGYTIIRQGSVQGKSGFTAQRIRLLGDPTTIIDVGVGDGTFALYDAFPDKNIVLIDPLLDKFGFDIKKIKQKYPHVYIVGKAAGEKEGSMNMRFETNAIEKSSLLERTELTEVKSGTEIVEVQIDRLDKIMNDLNLPGPYGLKVDAEGYELKVLMGAEGIFANLDFIIVEVNIAKRFEECYSFEEMVTYMNKKGFRVTDMLNFARLDPIGTRFLDLVFKKIDNA